MQKKHGSGNETRFFWDITVIGEKTSRQYRSRCASASAVKSQLKKTGITATSVKQVKA